MPNITLPDGTVKQFEGTVTGTTVAQSIGAGLAKAAVAMEINGIEKDLSEEITQDITLKFLTAKDAAGLDVMRHTLTAQVLARAVKELYPTAKLALGPTIEYGAYYDVKFAEPLSSDDLPKLEERMKQIIKENNSVTRELWEPEKLKTHFKQTGDDYKLEIIDGAVEKGDLIDGKYVSAWRQSIEEQDDFIDLCRGPHATSTGQLSKAFTLTSIAGAYWRGDSNNDMLTRIYMLSFAHKDDLKAHLHMMEEAKKRDHRKIGPFLDLFHLQEEAQGQVFWHDKGWTLFLELQNYIRRKLEKAGYIEVNTPQLVSNSLYKKSGHWDKFGTENMFLCEETDSSGVEHTHAMKPMNCPCHVQIFNTGNKSYRDLPLRMAEFGSCMRNEPHGALHGIMRVRAFTQDDAHVFCTPEQIESESVAFCELLGDIYTELGFGDYFVKFSDRPDMRVGDDAIWDKSEDVLKNACDVAKIDWTLNPGEGAFYGPKLEFVLRDCIGRDWQCGTLQVDFNTPNRLDAEFDTAGGDKEHPVMLHRAILGSLERFIGIMIENTEGKFPTWLAPTQVMIIPITDDQADYAYDIQKQLKNSGIVTATGGLRVEVDTASERMQKKILLAQQQKIPYMLVVGKKEAAEGTVAVRLRDGTDLGALAVADVIARLDEEIRQRG